VVTPALNIAGRVVSSQHPTLIIAEIGVNHDGSVERALELVAHAADAGADAVKLQVFRAETLIHASGRFADYQKQRVDDEGPAAMLRRYELPDEALRRIVKAIRGHGMLPLATPFSPSDVPRIAGLDLPAVKIASPDLVNRPLLQRCAELHRPLLVSTGAATMDEVRRAVGWLGEWRCTFALLHCVSGYPVASGDAQLCWISELSAFDAPVGYSDHTSEELAGALAVAAGACIVEKHLTHDRRAAGPDHSASADAAQFARYAAAIRLAERLRGKPGKRVLGCEADVRCVSRQSLVAAKALEAGQPITEDSLAVQRPGTGVSAAEIRSVIGRQARRPIAAGTMLEWEMLA
jgi:N-acetylneuraminate synthase/N,N'-diacetyllegionaminate synthase